MTPEIISKKTRTAFCEHLVSWTLRSIGNTFDAADITCDLEFSPQVSGQRRTLVHQYYHSLDLTKPVDARKLLQAFEDILNTDSNFVRQNSASHEATFIRPRLETIIKLLDRDGYRYADERLTPISAAVSLHSLKEAASSIDANYLRDHIQRIERAIDTDPTHAIGAAKELVETCCYTILSERKKPATDKPDLLPLVRRVQEELQLLPDGVDEQSKGAKSIKSLLGNLAIICQNLAELRNLYGTGHGKDGKARGLTPRHARLAVNAATTLTWFLFDTHKVR